MRLSFLLLDFFTRTLLACPRVRARLAQPRGFVSIPLKHDCAAVPQVLVPAEDADMSLWEDPAVQTAASCEVVSLVVFPDTTESLWLVKAHGRSRPCMRARGGAMRASCVCTLCSPARCLARLCFGILLSCHLP